MILFYGLTQAESTNLAGQGVDVNKDSCIDVYTYRWREARYAEKERKAKLDRK
jgi:hypothetical protein